MTEAIQSHPASLISKEHVMHVLAPRGLSAKRTAEMGARSVATPDELPKQFRGLQSAATPGLLFIWHSPTAGAVYQYRPDNPPEIDGHVAKYLFAPGSQMVLSELAKPQGSQPVLLVEGTMQSLAAAEHAPLGVGVYGISGCWSWRVGNTGTSIPDLAVLKGRTVLVVLDADAAKNRNVYDAGVALRDALLAESAKEVLFVRLAAGGKAGLDDVLGARPADSRTEYITTLIEKAQTDGHDKPAPRAPKARVDKSASVDTSGRRPVDATDLDVADAFVEMRGSGIRFDATDRRWLVYQDGVWNPEAGETLAKTEFRSLIRHDIVAVREDDEGERVDCRDWLYRTATMHNVLGMAQANPAVHVRSGDLDADPWLWNAANGVVNLRNGEFREHDPADLMTQQSAVPFDKNASCLHFEAWISEVLPNEAVREYVRRVLGLAMVGEVREHIFPVFIGTGRNGKGTLVRLVRRLFGPYASGIAKSLLVETKFSEHATVVTTLFKRRLATTEELSSRQAWNLSSVKELTGGDNLQGHRMRENEFTFKPSHTLLLSTNARPQINDADDGAEAFWRRYREIPFTVVFEHPSQEVEDRLYEELPGVLNWILDGLADYLRNGLQEPVEVTVATAAAKVAADPMHRFFAEELIRTDDKNDQITNRTMYEAYTAWCGRQVPRERPVAINIYSRKLANASGLEMPSREGKSNTRTWLGVVLAGDEGGSTGSATGSTGSATGSATGSQDHDKRLSSLLIEGAATGATGATGFSRDRAYTRENTHTPSHFQMTEEIGTEPVAPYAPVAAPPVTCENSFSQPVAEPVAELAPSLTCENSDQDLVAPPVNSQNGPKQWLGLLRTYATVTNPDVVCDRCGETCVADDELGIFQLCATCTGGTLRPSSDR